LHIRIEDFTLHTLQITKIEHQIAEDDLRNRKEQEDGESSTLRSIVKLYYSDQRKWMTWAVQAAPIIKKINTYKTC
jgi:hypothetical protein